MKRQELQLRRGWRINTENGMCERTSEECMSTFLLLHVLPVSKLDLSSDEYEYQVYFYSKEIPEEYIYTYSYQNEQQWTTYQDKEFVDEWRQGKTEFHQERYVRLLIRRRDRQPLTEQDEKTIEELLILEQPANVEDDYLQQPDVQKELQKTISTIKRLRTENSLVFTLLSDTHYVVNGNWEHTIATIREVNKQIHPDGIIHLGDLADGILDKELCSYYSHQVIDDIKKLGVPFYLTIGNHDTNYFRKNQERLNNEEQFAFYLEKTVDGSIVENQLWYDVDYPEQKLRFLFLHSFDAAEQIRYGFPEEELSWVRKKMEELPENYQVILFSHDAPLARLDFWADEIRNGEKLTAYLEEWHNAHENRILAYIHGHTHADFIYTERSFPIISIGCSKCEYFPDKKPEGSTRYHREIGTIVECLWDTMIVHPKEQRIDFVRFGAGRDRSIKNGKIRRKGMTQIWAHRGASGYAPENTLEAFELAIQMGADGIELDVQFTKDRELVVLHDERIDRTSNSTGYVADYTLSELKSMNFNKTHPEYLDVKIPTLKEVLELVKPTNLVVNIELKTGIRFYDGIEQAVIKLVHEMEMQDRIIYSSFNHESVMRVRRLCPSARIGFLYSDGIYRPADYAKTYGVEALHPSVNNMQYDNLIESCREKQIKLHVWTVNQEADMRRFINAGVDAIITNYPDMAYEVLHEEDADEEILSQIPKAKESIPKEERAKEEILVEEVSATENIQPVVQKAKNPILHALGVTYSRIRKVFVKIDEIVQRAAGR